MSERVGRGLTLKLALAAEDCPTVNEETWKKALAAHVEFSPHYEAGRGKFLELATRRLAKSKDLANLRWLLARRHSDLFGESPEVVVNNNIELPADVIELARQHARGKK